MSSIEMDDPSQVDVAMKTVMYIRYTAAGALILSLWDNFITFDQEVTYIWSSPFGLMQAVFFLTRYGNAVTLLYANYLFSGIQKGDQSTQIQCKIFPVVFGTVLMLYTSLYNVYIALRLYVLWDHRRAVKIMLCAALTVTYIPMFVLGEIGFVRLYKASTFVEEPFNSCFLLKNSKFIPGAFGGMAAFDLFVIIMATCNMLDRPRGPQHNVVSEMRRDGAVWFLILFVMRFTNFILSMVLSLPHMLTAFILIWALISVTGSRMILHIEALKRPLLIMQARQHVETLTLLPMRRNMLVDLGVMNGRVDISTEGSHYTCG